MIQYIYYQKAAIRVGMDGSAIIAMFKGMGVNNCTSVNNMYMIEESDAPEKFKEQKQKEPLLNIDK